MSLCLMGCPAPAEGEGEGEGGGGEGEGEEVDFVFRTACELDDDCPTGSVCTQFFDGFGNFTDFCSIACTANIDCAVSGADGVCISGFCLPTCTDSGDCDRLTGGGSCFDNVAAGIDACVKASGKACSVDSECGADEACGLVQGTDVAFFCAPVAEIGQVTGAACSTNAFAYFGVTCSGPQDCGGPPAGCSGQPGATTGTCAVGVEDFCASTFCNEGSCSGPCTVDAECPADNRCEQLSFTTAIGTQLVGMCAPFSGSGTPCRREADCGNGEHCGLSVGDDGGSVFLCRNTDAGDVEIGEVCGDNTRTPEVIEPFSGCSTNFCSGGVCRIICDADSDCAGGEVCLHTAIFGIDDPPGACFEGNSCRTNSECESTTEFCVTLRLADGIRDVCRPQTEGTRNGSDVCDPTLSAVGPSCFSNVDCTTPGDICELRSRQCVSFVSLCEDGCEPRDRQCSAPCVVDADCVLHGENARCEGRNFFESDPDLVRGFCINREGSLQSCAKNGDCTNPEVCALTANAAGVVGGVCQQPPADGIGANEPCSELGDRCAAGGCIGEPGPGGSVVSTCRDLCATQADCEAPLLCEVATDALGIGQDGLVCR